MLGGGEKEEEGLLMLFLLLVVFYCCSVLFCCCWYCCPYISRSTTLTTIKVLFCWKLYTILYYGGLFSLSIYNYNHLSSSFLLFLLSLLPLCYRYLLKQYPNVNYLYFLDWYDWLFTPLGRILYVFNFMFYCIYLHKVNDSLFILLLV